MKTSWHFVGAGARTIIQVGMIKYLVEKYKKPDMIFGCSGGALNAVLTAQGDIDLLEHVWLNISNKDVYSFAPWQFLLKKPAIYNLSPLQKTLAKYIDHQKLSMCSYPVYITVTSLKQNDETHMIVNNNHEIIDILTASASIPIFFPPLRGRYYDGGVTDNYSIEFAMKRGSEQMFVLHPNCVPNQWNIKRIADAIDVLITLPEWSSHQRQKQAIQLMPPETRPILKEVLPISASKISLIDFDYKGMNRTQLIQYGYNLAATQLA